MPERRLSLDEDAELVDEAEMEGAGEDILFFDLSWYEWDIKRTVRGLGATK